MGHNARRRVARKRLEGGVLRPVVLEVGIRKRKECVALRAVAFGAGNAGERARAAHGERIQDEGIQDRENGGVGAYAKCEGHNDNRREDWAFSHAADRVTEIAPETIPRTAWTSVARRHGIENWPAVFGTDAGFEEVRVVELCGGPPVGIVRRNTAGGQVVVQILEVLRDFLDELVFGRRRCGTTKALA